MTQRMRWNRLSLCRMEECWGKKKTVISACFRSPDRHGTFWGHQSLVKNFFVLKHSFHFFWAASPLPNTHLDLQTSSQTSSPAVIFIGIIPAFVRISVSGRFVVRTFGYFMNAENLRSDNEYHAGLKRLTNEKKNKFFSWLRAWFFLVDSKQMMESSRIFVQGKFLEFVDP